MEWHRYSRFFFCHRLSNVDTTVTVTTNLIFFVVIRISMFCFWLSVYECHSNSRTIGDTYVVCREWNDRLGYCFVHGDRLLFHVSLSRKRRTGYEDQQSFVFSRIINCTRFFSITDLGSYLLLLLLMAFLDSLICKWSVGLCSKAKKQC
jgi:hypothetical protein